MTHNERRVQFRLGQLHAPNGSGFMGKSQIYRWWSPSTIKTDLAHVHEQNELTYNAYLVAAGHLTFLFLFYLSLDGGERGCTCAAQHQLAIGPNTSRRGGVGSAPLEGICLSISISISWCVYLHLYIYPSIYMYIYTYIFIYRRTQIDR